MAMEGAELAGDEVRCEEMGDRHWWKQSHLGVRQVQTEPSI